MTASAKARLSGTRAAACFLTTLAALALAAPSALAARPYESQLTEANGTAFANPFGLAVDGSGNLWVADVRGEGVVDKFSSAGAFLAQGTGFTTHGNGYGRSPAFSDASNHLYVADSYADDLWVLNSDTTFNSDITGPWGSGCCFVYAAADNSAGATGGDVYVSGAADGSSPTPGAVYRVDGTGTAAPFSATAPYIEGAKLTGTPTEPFASPVGLAVGASGNLFVATAGAVYEFEPSGEFLREFTEAEGFPLAGVSAVAVDPSNGHVLVAAGSTIDEFGSSGSFLEALEGEETPAGSLGAIQGLAVDSSGRLYASDGTDAVIDVFGPAGPPLPRFALEVTKPGTGAGSVTSSPRGIDCGATCSHAFAEGKTVTLSAEPSLTSEFSGWSGCDAEAAGKCEVTMSAAKAVQATFTAIPQEALTVARTGSGQGTVTGTAPAGFTAIECGSTCEAEYNQGTTVTLTATAAAHSKFSGWSGPDCDESTVPTCEVTLSAAKSIAAEFTAIPQITLSVEKSGAGSGTVVSSAAGIECGPACSGQVDQGATVTLNATSGAASEFSGWSGCDSVAAAECEVTMSEAKSVTAAFAPAPACPNAALRTGPSALLPDCRAYEQVSPVDKNGNSAGAEISVATGNRPAPDYSVSRADGEGVLFGSAHETISGALGETESGINYYWVSARSAQGWFTHAALPPGNRLRANQIENNVQLDLPAPILPAASLREFAVVAQDSFGAAPLATRENGYVIREGGAVDWISQPTVASPVPPLNEAEGGRAVLIAGASPDLNTVYFGYSGTLVPEDELKDPAVEGISRAEVVAGETSRDVGFYEWRDGSLRSAGVLPDGTVDPYGAVPPSTQGFNGFGNTPNDYAGNQVSGDGAYALFVSPGPGSQAPASDPSELYLREQLPGGGAKSVLVSKSAIGGEPASSPPLLVKDAGISGVHGDTYGYASADGSRVFFEDTAQLTADAPSDESAKQYEFDTATEELHYLPGVTGTAPGGQEQNRSPIVVSSPDGSSFLFERNTPGGKELDLWNGHVTVVSRLPDPLSAPISIAPARSNRAGSAYVFQTNSPLPGESAGAFNNGGPFEQVYRYEAETGHLSCISCPPPGIAPSGSAHMSNATTQPGVLDSRGASADLGRVFFDTPDPLSPRDTNGRRDVYEWGHGEVHLISSGTSPEPSFLLDNDESGANVFFATTDPLSRQDSDGGYDVYDAREGGGFAPSVPPPACEGEGCQGPAAPAPTGPAASSAGFSGPGNRRARRHPKKHRHKHGHRGSSHRRGAHAGRGGAR